MKCLKGLLAGVMVLSMFACSSDDDLVAGAENNAGAEVGATDGVYAKLTLSLPAKRANGDGTASELGDGVEFGQNYENKVGSVLIVLAEKKADGTYAYITSSLSDGTLVSGTGTGSTNNPVYTVVFENSALQAFGGKDVVVFAYANPTSALRTLINGLETGASFTDEVATLNAGNEIWTNNAFFMTSVGELNEITLDADIATSTAHNTPEKALNLGKVPVERVAARFDYKQVNGNRYPVKTSVTDEDGNVTTEEVADVVLTDMALINMATQYYYLPRTSANGKNENINLCPGQLGMEDNWVVSPNWEAFLSYNSTSSPVADNYFMYPMNNNGNWEWQAIASLGQDDNDDSWNQGETNYGDYKIWRYAVENTIPESAGYAAQKKGITTGVVFKGHIEVSDQESPLYRAYNAGEAIYMFNEVIYGGVQELAAAVEASPVSTLADAFNAAFNKVVNVVNGEEQVSYTEKNDVKFGELGFTVYRKNADGEYPVYYYYYNRHNDNGENNIMGAMEFGVVRNNVYKLFVTNINRFGHPSTDPDDPEDPDPEDPDDPDEENKIYFKVSVEVLPWVVRVNNIEF